MLLGVPLAGCRREGAAPRLEPSDVTVEVGFADVVDDRHWNALRFVLRNPGEDFRGTLTVQGIREGWIGEPRDPLSYSMELEIPGKGSAPKEISFPVRAEDWSHVDVKLRGSGGGGSFRFELPRRNTAVLARLLVVSERPRSYVLLRESLEDTLRLLSSRDDAQCFEISVATPKGLPPFAAAYDPFQAILLDGTSLASAAPEVIDALRGWTEAGGTLVALPGREWAAGLVDAFAGLVGVSASGGDAPMPERLAEALGEGAASGIWRDLEAAPGALPAGDLAFSSERGTGKVLTFAFNPAGLEFPGPAQAPAIHEILRPALLEALCPPLRPGGWLDPVESASAPLLDSLLGLRIPTAGAVLTGLAVYLALGFIVPAVVFGILRRREWTFAVVILAAVVATVAIYRYGVLSDLGGTQLAEISVLRLHPDGRTAEATSFVGIASAARRALRIDEGFFAADGAGRAVRGAVLARPASSDPVDGYPPRSEEARQPSLDYEADPAHRVRLAPVDLYPNGARYFRFDYRISTEELLRVRRLRAAELGGPRVAIENPSGSEVKSWLFDGPDHAYLGFVGPGGQAELYDGGEPPERDPALHPGSIYGGGQILPTDHLLRVLATAFANLQPGEDLSSVPRPSPLRDAVGKLLGKEPEEAVEPREPRRIVSLSAAPVFPVSFPVAARKAYAIFVVELER